MSNMVRHASEATRGPSPAIFGDFSKVTADWHRGQGFGYFDDFLHWHTTTTNSTDVLNPWSVVADDGFTVIQLVDPLMTKGEYGVLYFNNGDADNDYCYMTPGSLTGGSFVLDESEIDEIGWEIRMLKVTVADAGLTFLCGLGRYDLAADGTLVDGTGAIISTADFIGFSCLDDDGDAVDAVSIATGQTLQTNASVATLTADTYVKLGFKYRPADGTNKLRYYVNGSEVSTTAITDLTAATFPDNIVMDSLIGFKQEGTGNAKAQVDWVAAHCRLKNQFSP